MAEKWRPRIASGDFYVRDRHYFQYGEKETYTFEELSVTEFNLTGVPDSLDSVSVTVEGHAYTDFRVSGGVLKVRHPDPHEWEQLHGSGWDVERQEWHDAGYGFNPTGEVIVNYDQLEESAATGIVTGSLQETFSLNEGAPSYSIPAGGCHQPPLIMTDDRIQPGNAREFVPEYSLDPNTHEILIGRERNRIINPAFCAGGTHPAGWANGADNVARLRVIDAYYGKYVSLLDATSAEASYSQSVVVEESTDYTLSAFVRRRTTSPAAAGYLSVAGIATGIIAPGYAWERAELSFSSPSGITSIDSYLGATSGQLEFDAVQLEEAGALTGITQFGFISPDSTLEAECDPTGIYIYKPSRQAPFDFDESDVNPINLETSRGFLSIGDYPASHYDEPIGKGGYVRVPEPTGEFIVYKGTGTLDVTDTARINAHELVIMEGPPGTGSTPYGFTADEYGILNVGAVRDWLEEYDTNFTTDAPVNYPSGIQNESWVTSETDSGEYPINLYTGYSAWLDVLKWRMKYIMMDAPTLTGLEDFKAIVFEGIKYGAGVSPYIDVPDQAGLMNNLMLDLKNWADGELTTPILWGVSDYERSAVTLSEIVTGIDFIVVDGLSIGRSFATRTELERNSIRSQVINIKSAAAEAGPSDIKVYAHDYVQLVPDDDHTSDTIPIQQLRDSRNYAYREGWDYNWTPNDGAEVYVGTLGQYAELEDYGMGTGVVPPGTGVGRMHTGWGKVSGYNKLRLRDTFHQESRPVNEDISSARIQSIPDSIAILSNNSMSRGVENRPLAYPTFALVNTTVVEWEFYGVKVGTNTDAAGKLYADITIGTVGTDPYITVKVYKDAGKTPDNQVAEGYMFGGGAAPSVFAYPTNSSGLTLGLFGLGGATGTATITFTDPWVDDRGEDESLRIGVRYDEAAVLDVVLRDTIGNPMDSAYVFAAAPTGVVTPDLSQTNRSGREDYAYNYTGTPAASIENNMAFDADRISFENRGSFVEDNTLVDLAVTIHDGSLTEEILDPLDDEDYFGDGSDGSLVLGTGQVETLAGNKQYDVIHMWDNAILNTNGYKVQCSVLCDLIGTAVIRNNGGDGAVFPAAGGTGAAGGFFKAGGTGGAAQLIGPVNGLPGADTTGAGRVSSSGAPGDGGPDAPQTGGLAGSSPAWSTPSALAAVNYVLSSLGGNVTGGAGAGGGAIANGTRDVSASGGGGGGVVFLAAKNIFVKNNARIQANGGDGGDTGNHLAGGGGGGAGGTVIIAYRTLTEVGDIQALGGTEGEQSGANPGQPGSNGKVFRLDLDL